MKNELRILALSAVLVSSTAFGQPDLPLVSDGLHNFQQHRWLDAMADFLEVLKQDPNNATAHKYIPLTIHEIEAQNKAVLRDMRLTMLDDASKRLGTSRRDTTLVDSAVFEITHSEERANEERWARWLEEAKVEHQEGHLLAANDVVLRIISEKRNHVGAQQELSALQTDIRNTLEGNGGLLIQERYALQGFYAYGQSNFDAAAVAWRKAVTILQQTYPKEEVSRQVGALHFLTYAKFAEEQVAERARLAAIDKRFEEGITLFKEGHFARALEAFREVALARPDYPNLSLYLVQAETGVEKERTRLLTAARRREVTTYLQKGVDAMEYEKYPEAQEAFQHVLQLDASNPTASSYLNVVQAEIKRLHDPKTAQKHYEAGLIAYASGKLEEAIREWRIATRMDPQNEKAVNAYTKAQKELALNEGGLQ